MNKGGVAFDELKLDELPQHRDLWWKVLKNLRAGVMPPAKKPQPSPEERDRIEQWIKFEAFGIDPKNLDPGRMTMRRLNRVEYRNTIHDLMGIDYNTEEEFPPDDAGYGFDNIGDVLTVSPLLLEKYLQAAETIVTAAVPTIGKIVRETVLPGAQFHGTNAPPAKDKTVTISFYKPAKLAHTISAPKKGEYQISLDLAVRGAFDFDPGRCRLIFRIDGRERLNKEFGWEDNKKFPFAIDEKWEAGEHHLEFELQPLTPVDEKKTSVDLRINSVAVKGPMARPDWVHPANYDRFFFKDDAPEDAAARKQYAREVLGRFAKMAFRRPADERTLDRSVALAEQIYTAPGKRFEEGIARAMVAVLASPRFLFRIERNETARADEPSSFVDEYTLASRLSYFLWSTMPDAELFRLADRGLLRKNLSAQVKRLLADPRSEALIDNFTGQWLQARDVEGISISSRDVLARDKGEEKELKRQIEEFRARLAKRQAEGNKGKPPIQRPNFFNRPTVELDRELRLAMRRETEMFFANIVREDRSVLEMIDSDYTFLNERLAKHYGIQDVQGTEMRKVTLPKESPRGGVLTQGSILVVTSNPTRTSPVKRGQFVLDNLLGLPAPPPPANIPQLEESEKQFKDREPTLREVLEAHRSKPLCASCHSRMDPLGLSLENFNALGMWREKERNQPIDASGKLISGEDFHDIRELKRILKERHRLDFYRCLTEKLLTYAFGRGLEWHDVETVDQIVERLDREQGRFSALLNGLVESVPFQKRRINPPSATDQPVRVSQQTTELKLPQP